MVRALVPPFVCKRKVVAPTKSKPALRDDITF